MEIRSGNSKEFITSEQAALCRVEVDRFMAKGIARHGASFSFNGDTINISMREKMLVQTISFRQPPKETSGSDIRYYIEMEDAVVYPYPTTEDIKECNIVEYTKTFNDEKGILSLAVVYLPARFKDIPPVISDEQMGGYRILVPVGKGDVLTGINGPSEWKDKHLTHKRRVCFTRDEANEAISKGYRKIEFPLYTELVCPTCLNSTVRIPSIEVPSGRDIDPNACSICGLNTDATVEGGMELYEK